MKIVQRISVAELKEMAQKMDGNIVKADIDIAKRIMIIDMPMHYEGEQELIEQGSKQADLWGINLLPVKYHTDEFIMYESLINIKVHQNNPNMTIKSTDIRNQIKHIVDEVVYE